MSATAAAPPKGRRPSLPPGPSLPPVAQTLAFIRSPEKFMSRTREAYGDVFTVRVLGAPPLVVIADPKAIRDVFTGPADVMLAGQANATLEPLVGPRSVLLLDRDEHLAERAGSCRRSTASGCRATSRSSSARRGARWRAGRSTAPSRCCRACRRSRSR